MKMNIFRLVLLVFTLISFSIQLKSQIDCPADDPNCPWVSQNYYVERTPYVFDLSIQIQTRDCNGVLEVKPDWSTLIGLRYYYLSQEALREVFMNEYVLGLSESTVPICGQGTKKVNFYFKSECKIQTRCTYKINPAERNCDGCYPGPDDYYEKNGEYFIDIYKWVTCGEKCCRWQFEVCKVYDNVYNKYKLSIQSKNKYEVTPCSPSACTDWETGFPIPCLSNCEQK